MRDDGKTAFLKIWPKIFFIKARQSVEPSFLKDNAWHLSTLFNTFNAYYCYDVHPKETRRTIRPIFIRFNKEDDNELGRLLSIEIVVIGPEEEEPIYDIAFNFDSEHIKIRRLLFHEFVPFVHDDMYSKPLYYDYNESDITDKFVHYTDAETDLGILPFKCDIGTDEKGTRSLSGLFGNLYINYKYVSPIRITEASEESLHCFSPFDESFYSKENITPLDRKRLISYAFGSDLGYLNANFNKSNTYTPTCNIRWDSSTSNSLEILSTPEYGLLYLPNTEKLNSMKTYDEDISDYHGSLRISTRSNESNISLYNKLFASISRHLIIEEGDTLLQLGTKEREETDDWDVAEKIRNITSTRYMSTHELEIQLLEQERVLEIMEFCVDELINRMTRLIEG